MLKLTKIPTYVVSVENPYLLDGDMISVITGSQLVVLNKTVPSLNYYNLSDFLPTTGPSFFPAFFAEADTVFSNYTLPQSSFLKTTEPLFLDDVVWGKNGGNLTVINGNKDIKEFYNVQDYQFDNEKFALLQQDVLNFYDYTYTKIGTYQGISNFMYSEDELFVMNQDGLLSKSIDKYDIDTGVMVTRSFINRQEAFNVVGIDSNYVYTNEDTYKARARGSLNIIDDLTFRTMVIDGNEIEIITPHEYYRSRETFYSTPAWNPNVGLNPF